MDADRSTTRKTSRLLMLLALVAILVVGAVVVVQGCHEPNDMEERINPDDPLPGAQTALPFTPESVA